MTPAPIRLDPRPLVAFLAAGRVWLVELMAWLARVFGVERAVRGALLRDLRELQHAAAMLAFIDARRAFVLRTLPPEASHPQSSPPGVRRRAVSDSRRVSWRIVPRGLGLAGRCAALRQSLDSIPALVKRLVRLLCKAPREAFVMVGAPVERVLPQATVDAARADTS